MKKLAILMFFIMLCRINHCSAQNACVNADFSSGTFTNWTGSTGENDDAAAGTYTNIVPGMIIGNPNSSPDVTDRQTIMTAPGTDPNTGNALSILAPGGAYSCRLGNDRVSGCDGGNPQAERLEYTYKVDSLNYLFSCQYAIVLQDPGTSHTVPEKPKFTICVLDSNIIIDTLNLIAGSIPGANVCSPSSIVCSPTEFVNWTDWTTIDFNLNQYRGRNITIQFTTLDCSLGGHFGYAYISCYCGKATSAHLVQQCSGNSVIITAPSGFSTYQWSTGDTTNYTTILNPALGDTITCICDSNIVLSTTISVQAVTGLTINAISNCQGGVTLTASGNYSYVWSTGFSGQSITVSPTNPTVYTVTAYYPGAGCSATASITVTMNPTFTSDICMVTADTATNHNKIIWEKPVTGAIDKYYIYRESSVSGIYNLIGTQNYSTYSIFIDTSSNSLQQPYRYELANLDTCGNISPLSNYHQTIHLTINAGSNGSWNLIWNDYIGVTVNSYNIYRGTSKHNLTLLTSVSSNVTSYSDLTPPPGSVYYLLEAVTSTVCNPSKAVYNYSSIISNISGSPNTGIAELDSDNFIQVSPNPANGLFTITLQSIPKQEMELAVLNSLGQEIVKDIMKTASKTIDLTDYSKGIYYLKISSGEKYLFRKIVIN